MRRGVERFTYNLSNQLAGQYGIEIVLYIWNNRIKVDWGEWHENITIRKVPYSRYFQKNIAQLFYRIWIKQDKPSFVLINFLYHGETCLPKNINYYYVLHSPATLIQNRYKYIANRIESFNNLTPVAVSDFVRDEARPFFKNKTIRMIHHGIDINIFNKCVVYRDKPVIKMVTTSALEEWKGIQDIIQALSMIEKIDYFRLDIYGDGLFKVDLIELIDYCNLNDIVSIKEPASSIENILPDYDIYCQMSVGEAFGLSLFEAMACGLSAIVYDSPPFNKLLPDDVVKKVLEKSIKIIKSALLDYLDCAEREKYGTRARDFVRKNFSLDKMASNYFKLFNETVN